MVYNEDVDKNQYFNQAGYSLIDLMMASALSIIIISTCYSIMLFQLEQLRAVKALYAQSLVLTRVKLAITKQNIIASAQDSENKELKACLTGVDGTACSSSNSYFFKLIDGIPVTGLPDKEVGYNLDGQPCAIGVTSDCIFKLGTTFRVQCPDDLANPFYHPQTCPSLPSLLNGLIEVYFEFGVVQNKNAPQIVGLKTITRSIIVRM